MRAWTKSVRRWVSRTLLLPIPFVWNSTTLRDLLSTEFFIDIAVPSSSSWSHAGQETTAEEVRRIAGFDRVMVYRFDPEWNGEVIAEAKVEDTGSYLHHRFPASDIPAQARQLYTLNWIRFIPTVDYRPAGLLGTADLAEPLDMSFSVLRSVSPIHLEYLKNMGVTASMSISLLHDG